MDESLSATDLVGAGIQRLVTQLINENQKRNDERFQAQQKRNEELEAAFLESRGNFIATENEVRTVKQQYQDLARTVTGVSSSLTEHAQALHDVQEKITVWKAGLEEIYPMEIRSLQGDINRLTNTLSGLEEKLNALHNGLANVQAKVNQQQPLVDLFAPMTNALAVKVEGPTTVQAASLQSTAVAALSQSNCSPMITDKSLPPLPSQSVMPDVENSQYCGMRNESLVSSATFGGSYERNIPSRTRIPIVPTTEEIDEDQDEEDSDPVTKGTKRSASQRSSAFSENGQQTSALKRRRGQLNLKETQDSRESVPSADIDADRRAPDPKLANAEALRDNSAPGFAPSTPVAASNVLMISPSTDGLTASSIVRRTRQAETMLAAWEPRKEKTQGPNEDTSTGRASTKSHDREDNSLKEYESLTMWAGTATTMPKLQDPLLNGAPIDLFPTLSNSRSLSLNKALDEQRKRKSTKAKRNVESGRRIMNFGYPRPQGRCHDCVLRGFADCLIEEEGGACGRCLVDGQICVDAEEVDKLSDVSINAGKVQSSEKVSSSDNRDAATNEQYQPISPMQFSPGYSPTSRAHQPTSQAYSPMFRQSATPPSAPPPHLDSPPSSEYSQTSRTSPISTARSSMKSVTPHATQDLPASQLQPSRSRSKSTTSKSPPPAASQRRSGRAPKQKEGLPGQVFFKSGKVPDYSKGF